MDRQRSSAPGPRGLKGIREPRRRELGVGAIFAGEVEIPHYDNGPARSGAGEQLTDMLPRLGAVVVAVSVGARRPGVADHQIYAPVREPDLGPQVGTVREEVQLPRVDYGEAAQQALARYTLSIEHPVRVDIG